MPQVYRVMEEEDGLPKVGNEKNMLGVRVPPDPHADIIPDENGNVHPGIGGMSVAPNWRDLPLFLIPRRLNSIVKGARGTNRNKCWRYGEGEFESGDITGDLQLRCTRSTHGLIEPSHEMSIDSFQDALAATRERWQFSED